MGNNLRVALDPFQTRLFGVSAGQTAVPGPDWQVQLLRGDEKLAAMRPMLEELGRRTGQESALDSLDYLLGGPTMRGKVPYLVLVGLRAGVDGDQATADDVQGLVLLHEYQIAGRGSRVFATHDINGQRTVFAPAEIRTQVAEAAARCLIRQGALLMLICVELEPEAAYHPVLSASMDTPCRIAARIRSMSRDLLIGPSLEATLATLGRNTRRNFRRYRQRLEADLGATFIPRVEISREEFLTMNRTSTNPAPDEDAAWRYECIASLPGTMFAGVKSGDGRWLSMIGGRRYDGITEIEWQMNRSGLPRHSLSTVMRAYLLEHEVEIATSKLVFQGGTPHSMRHSLVNTGVLDMLVMSRSPLAGLVLRFASWIFPESNFLGRVLQDEDLIWIQR